MGCSTTFNRDHRLEYAGVWIRGAALVVDFAVLSALFFPLTRLVKGVWIMSAADHRWADGWFVTDPLCLVFLAVIFLYFVFLEAWRGATLGKRLLGLRVVAEGTSPPGLKRALLRNLFRLVDGLPAFCLLGAILIATSKEGARFGDRMAGTRVIRWRRSSTTRPVCQDTKPGWCGPAAGGSGNGALAGGPVKRTAQSYFPGHEDPFPGQSVAFLKPA